MPKVIWLALFSFCNRNHTTCFIDKAFGYDWGSCSKRHDKRYENTRLTRRQADELLYRCFKRKVNIVFAFIGYILVRLLGWMPYYFAQKEKKVTLEELTAEVVEDKNKYIKISKLVNDHLISVSSDVHTIKTIQGKGNLLIIGLVFITGVAFGMNKTSWLPYVEGTYKMFSKIPTIKGQ